MKGIANYIAYAVFVDQERICSWLQRFAYTEPQRRQVARQFAKDRGLNSSAGVHIARMHDRLGKTVEREDWMAV